MNLQVRNNQHQILPSLTSECVVSCLRIASLSALPSGGVRAVFTEAQPDRSSDVTRNGVLR